LPSGNRSCRAPTGSGTKRSPGISAGTTRRQGAGICRRPRGASRISTRFTGRRVVAIGQAEATAYALARQKTGAANGTINRELTVLNRMLRLAYEAGKVLRLPVIRQLKESAPRQGFFEQEPYLAVRTKLPEDLQVAVANRALLRVAL
jgi:hypothetical protein